MVEEGKKAEEKAAAQASAASPSSPKEGVNIAAAATGGGGTEDEVEGEEDDKPCPKVSSTNKVNSALRASRTPYAKPEGETVCCFVFGDWTVSVSKLIVNCLFVVLVLVIFVACRCV